MSNQRKTYFLCPTWDYHPDGPIQLGSIILSPSKPAEVLNAGLGRLPPPQDAVFPATSKTGVVWSKEQLRSGRYGLWTKFLSAVLGLSVDAGVQHDASVEQAYAFDRIDTIEFMPTPEYLARSLAAAPAVVGYLDKSRLRKHVYMITALKIVRGAHAKSAVHKSRGASLGVSLDGTAVAAPVSLGPEARGEWSSNEGTSFGSSSDFVFAFRLRKIVVHRRTGAVSHAEYTESAMYSEDSHPEAELQDLPFEVQGLATEDASAQDFGWEAVEEIATNEDENECACIVPRPE